MKIKKQLIVGIIILFIALLLPTISRAGVESKPGATTIWTKITISDAYKVCYDLRYATSTLGTNTLDPHLSLNKDWGAVTYLGLSSYGAVKDATGPSVSISGTSYTTTTGNKTGIMDFGKNKTYTSSIITGTTSDAKNTECRKNLINELNNNSKYVENITSDSKAITSNTNGMALMETMGWYGSKNTFDGRAPCLVRVLTIGADGYNIITDGRYGAAVADITFRPAIWN